MSTQTVGEMVQQRGYSELMLRIVALAKAVGAVPCGEWDYTFRSDPGWRVCVNGGPHATWTPPEAPAIPRFEAYVAWDGLPAALLNAAGGVCLLSEDRILAALAAEVAHVAGASQG